MTSAPAGEGGPASNPDEVQPAKDASGSPSTPDRGSGPGAVAVIVMVVAGVLAAVLGWTAQQQLERTFRLPERLENLDAMTATEQEMAEWQVENRKTNIQNLSVTMGLTGIAFAALLGVTGGLLHGSARSAVIGLVLGLVLGAIFGVAGGVGDFLIYERLQTLLPEGLRPTVQAMIAHGTLWLSVGVAAGLAVGIATGTTLRTTVAVAFAGLIAGALFAPLGTALGLVFPHAKPEVPVPVGTELRMVWFLLAGLLMALAAGRSLPARIARS